MAKTYNLSSEIRGALRLIFRRSPQYREALKKSRIEKEWLLKDGTPAKKPSVYYRCFSCQKDFKVTEVQIHHLEKVGPAPGSKNAPADLDWDAFIARIFCSVSKLVTACKNCHAKLTKEGK